MIHITYDSQNMDKDVIKVLKKLKSQNFQNSKIIWKKVQTVKKRYKDTQIILLSTQNMHKTDNFHFHAILSRFRI
jgi:hypothetical protein